jgi:hypothetical protein
VVGRESIAQPCSRWNRYRLGAAATTRQWCNIGCGRQCCTKAIRCAPIRRPHAAPGHFVIADQAWPGSCARGITSRWPEPRRPIYSSRLPWRLYQPSPSAPTSRWLTLRWPSGGGSSPRGGCRQTGPHRRRRYRLRTSSSFCHICEIMCLACGAQTLELTRSCRSLWLPFHLPLRPTNYQRTRRRRGQMAAQSSDGYFSTIQKPYDALAPTI